MKTYGKTIKPRKQELNQMLLEMGHDRHHARKGKQVPRAKQKTAWKREIMLLEDVTG